MLNGGDLGQAFKAGVVGGASGFLAFAAGSISGSSINAILERMGRHAFVNAWMSGIQGQNMLSGALTGSASSLGGAGLTSLNIENVGLLAAGNAVIGGTVSVIGGGKFANGAVTGAFTMLFNELAHEIDQKAGSLGDLKKGPPDNPEYESPKGGDRKVRNPNGKGWGWIDRKGRVWVPDDHNGTHAPHWDRQEPKGGAYTPVYPFAQPAFDPSMRDRIGQIVGLSGTALTIYIIISEGSRLFPPRNLVPIP